MFLDLNKNLRDERRGPSRLHPKRPWIKKSCFIDHNEIPRVTPDYRVKPLTPEQVERINEALRYK